MSLTAYEREVVITFNEESKTAKIYTASRPMMTKIDKLCKSSPKNYKLLKEDEYSKTYEVSNKSLISFRAGKVKKEMTEEQKLIASERMKKLHRKSKSE